MWTRKNTFFSFLIPSITQSLFKQHENKFQSLSTVNDVACLRFLLDVVPFFSYVDSLSRRIFHFQFAWHGKIKLKLSVSIGNTRHFYHFPFQLYIYSPAKVLRHHHAAYHLNCEMLFFLFFSLDLKFIHTQKWLKGQLVIWETHWLSCNKLTSWRGDGNRV